MAMMVNHEELVPMVSTCSSNSGPICMVYDVVSGTWCSCGQQYDSRIHANRRGYSNSLFVSLTPQNLFNLDSSWLPFPCSDGVISFCHCKLLGLEMLNQEIGYSSSRNESHIMSKCFSCSLCCVPQRESLSHILKANVTHQSLPGVSFSSSCNLCGQIILLRDFCLILKMYGGDSGAYGAAITAAEKRGRSYLFSYSCLISSVGLLISARVEVTGCHFLLQNLLKGERLLKSGIGRGTVDRPRSSENVTSKNFAGKSPALSRKTREINWVDKELCKRSTFPLELHLVI